MSVTVTEVCVQAHFDFAPPAMYGSMPSHLGAGNVDDRDIFIRSAALGGRAVAEQPYAGKAVLLSGVHSTISAGPSSGTSSRIGNFGKCSLSAMNWPEPVRITSQPSTAGASGFTTLSGLSPL